MSLFILTHAFGFNPLRSKWTAPIFVLLFYAPIDNNGHALCEYGRHPQKSLSTMKSKELPDDLALRDKPCSKALVQTRTGRTK
jgi:hypothetical protein